MCGVQEKYTHEFTSVMEAEATQFYFNHYREHFSTPLIAKVMSCIPQVCLCPLLFSCLRFGRAGRPWHVIESI